MEKVIIKCRGADLLPIDRILEFQGGLKRLSQTNRKCYGMEIDEHYCDVIVNRYKEWCIKNNKEYTIKLNGVKHE